MSALESINDFRVFDAVARSASLSSAARSLAISLPSVSKRLKHMEDALGVRLVQRSTRRLALTAEGEAFHERCRTILGAVAELDELGAGGVARGTIRVTATAGFAQRHIAPRLARFLDANPAVDVQVLASDRQLDLIENRIDLAFRQAPLGDGRLVTRTIAPDALLLCASPAYLAAAGTPAAPADLARHRCLVVGDPAPRAWTLHRAGEVLSAPVRPALSSLDGEVVQLAALAGAGIALKASWDVVEEIRDGRLVRVLPEWWGHERALRIVLPVRRHQPHRVRGFVAFMEAELRRTVRDNADLGVFPAAGTLEPRVGADR